MNKLWIESRFCGMNMNKLWIRTSFCEIFPQKLGKIAIKTSYYVGVRRITHALARLSWQLFLPRHPPATPSFLPLPGANVQFSLCTQQFRKNRLYFLRKREISSRPRRFCEGFPWGWHGEYEKRTEGVGQGAGERICLRKPCFSGFFRTSFNYSDTPEGERMRGVRGMAWGRRT